MDLLNEKISKMEEEIEYGSFSAKEEKAVCVVC